MCARAHREGVRVRCVQCWWWNGLRVSQLFNDCHNTKSWLVSNVWELYDTSIDTQPLYHNAQACRDCHMHKPDLNHHGHGHQRALRFRVANNLLCMCCTDFSTNASMLTPELLRQSSQYSVEISSRYDVPGNADIGLSHPCTQNGKQAVENCLPGMGTACALMALSFMDTSTSDRVYFVTH